MSLETRWLIEKRILYHRFFGDVRLEELRVMDRGTHDYLDPDDTIEMCYVVVDLREVRMYPKNLRRIVAQFEVGRSSKIRRLSFTNDPMIRFFGTVVGQVVGVRLRIFSDPSAAVTFLLSLNDTLPAFSFPVPKPASPI